MIRRTAPLTTCLVLVGVVLSARPASADIISLSTAFGGNAAAGDIFDLIVSFDANGVEATNLVGLELYVGFTGLLPVLNSYQLGSVFTPFADDILAADGTCADVGCNYPLDDPFSAQHYLSLVNVFSPSTPSGPGVLFTMQFVASASTPWSLNLFGDDAFGLLWDPPPQVCDGSDPACDPDPVVASIPYVIVPTTALVATGTARVNVDVSVPAPPPASVPEPSSLLLLGIGFIFAASMRRRSRS